MYESIFAIAAKLFLITNPIGNAPTIMALVKNFDFQRQKKIILREAVFSLLIALFFQFFGEHFINLLQLENYAVSLTGGILLLFVALEMLFPQHQNIEVAGLNQEPFIVPIATPLLSGPGLLSIIILNTKEVASPFILTGAILVAWTGVIGILAIAPYLQKILGKRGMLALEQLMGLFLTMLSIVLIEKGVVFFMNSI